LIAARYGVEIPRDIAMDFKLRIGHLVPTLNNVTIAGRVVAVYPAKAFEGKQSGKYASLIIADKDGLLRVMLWNDKTDLVELDRVRVGQVIRFLGAYTREDRNGKTELHISERGDFEVNPEGLEEEDFPSIDRFASAIKDMMLSQSSVNLVGKVMTVSPPSTFTRQDNTVGKVLRFTIADRTGNVVVLAWNGKAETLEALLKAEAEIKLVNAKVKPASSGGLEVHVDDSTYVDVSDATKES
jgi:ssDNA-binding replication factor A large subunit